MTANAAGKVPIIACVRSAWLFFAQNIRQLAPAAAICAVISQIGMAVSLLSDPSGQAASSSILNLIPAMVAGLMFSASVLRKAVRNEFVAPVGLTLGKDETRLLAVGFSITLVAIPLVFVLSIVLLGPILGRIASTPEAMEALAQDPEAMRAAIEQALGPGGLLALEIGGILLLCLALGLIAFMQAATIGEKRVMVFQALRWTGGNFLRVLAAIILTIAPTVILTTIIGLAVSPAVTDVATYLLVTTLIAFVGNIFAIPISALGAVLYKGLRPADFVAK
jgi:hypothetical protein